MSDMTPAERVSVVYNIHPYAMHLPGGGEVQLLKYKEYLPSHGCEVILHDIWEPRLHSAALFHHFHLVSGGIPFVDYVRRLGLKTLLSPNLWINETNQANLNTAELQTYYALADRIICNSMAEIDNLEQYSGLPRAKACVVHNGVDSWFSELVDPTAFRAWSNIQGPFLLNVANVEPRKNQVAAIQAAAAVGLPLVSIGRVRDTEYYARCIEAGRGGHFVHLGPLAQTDERLRSAYQECSAFVMPSTLETPGIAALEAAAAGAPVVITSEGSAYEYFGGHAYYVHPNDQEGIVNAVNLAINNPANDLLQKRILENFSWPQVTSSLMSCYAGLSASSCA